MLLKKQELFLIFMALLYFCLFGGILKRHSKSVSYFVFLILFINILPLIKIILIKIYFYHLISLNVTIFLCLHIVNLDSNKILMTISQLYYLTISCVKKMANNINFFRTM